MANKILHFLPTSASGIADDRDVLMTRPEAAQYLRRSVPTLERWAREGVGPRPRKIPGTRGVFYTLSELRAASDGDSA
jgi:hypothetical protein